jgi:AAA domain
MISRASRGKLDGDLAGKPCQALRLRRGQPRAHTRPETARRRRRPRPRPLLRWHEHGNGQHAGLQIPRDVDVIDHWLGEHHAARIVVLDPVVAMIPATLNAHRDQHVRQALAPLATLVDKHQVACILVMHLNKNTEGDALNRLSGSIGFGGAARSVLLFANNPDDPRGETGNQRVLAHVKCNVGPRQPSIGYRIEARTIDANGIRIETSIAVRDADMAISATDLLTGPTSTGEATARGEAREFLLAELADGPVATNMLKKHAEDAGISWPTVERAKKQLGIRARRLTTPNAHWVWPPPNTPP